MSAGITASQVREHMDVVCADGGKVGVVDRVEGDRIKLTKNDSPDGKHHAIPMDWVMSVDDKVHLSLPGDRVRDEWQDA